MTIFLLKEIDFFNRSVKIILQNQNGPCPLLAVSNVLILENRLHLPSGALTAGLVEDNVLLECVANAIMDSQKEKTNSHSQAVHEVIEKLPATMHGIDLNIRFLSADLFEFTPNISFFDILGVTLFHGWVIDPSRKDEYEVLSKLSYNEAMNKLVMVDSTKKENEEEKSDRDEGVIEKEAALIRSFLENEGVGQLTFQGLVQLLAVVRERSLSVLYRNNHFSTLFKYNDSLYTLVTDSGYADEHGVVWETVDYDSISGDSTFRPAFSTPSLTSATTPQAEVRVIESNGTLPIVFDLQNRDDGPRNGSITGGKSNARTFTRKTPEASRECARPSCSIM